MSAWLEKFRQVNWRSMDALAPLLLVALIVYLCWTLASLLWLLLAPAQAMQFDRVQLGSQQQAVPNIGHFALFKAQQAPQQLENSNMSLHGVMVAQPRRLSSAVIKANNVAERYRVGDFVADTPYRLAEVYWDKVILRDVNGASQILNMGSMETLNQDLSGQTQNPRASSVAPMQAPPNNPQAAIGQAVQQMQDNREQYLQSMGASPTGEGYEVSARTPLALRRKLGLQPGDRVLSLNGQPLAAGQNEAQLLEQARQSGQVKLEIKRGDQVMTIQQDLD